MSVVATLATAPLVALYFQVVSLLGILVNLVAIPLVLLLALPLGEAAVISQALSLTPVAQVLLFLGNIPLWLGYQAVEWGARVPGSAIITPTPTWLMIAAYYAILILVFYPRRTYLTWAGAGLAGLVLVAAIALPLATAPQALEVTCLDAYGGLEGVVVTPENRRLVVSAAVPPRWGRPAPGWGPLPGYCHWRQFRRLDLAIALNLNEANAGELLTLARQFTVGSYWYGRRERDGPAYWDLANYLGDRGATPRSLERGSPPGVLGSVDLKYVKLAPDAAPALEVAYQGQRVLLIPPVRGLSADDLPAAGRTACGPGHPRGTGRPPGPQSHPGPPEPPAGGRLWRLRPVRRRPVSLARALPVHPGGGGEPLPDRLRGDRPAVAAGRVRQIEDFRRLFCYGSQPIGDFLVGADLRVPQPEGGSQDPPEVTACIIAVWQQSLRSPTVFEGQRDRRIYNRKILLAPLYKCSQTSDFRMLGGALRTRQREVARTSAESTLHLSFLRKS